MEEAGSKRPLDPVGPRTEKLAAACAIARLARLLERGNNVHDAGRANDLCRTLHLVRGCCQDCKVIGAGGTPAPTSLVAIR